MKTAINFRLLLVIVLFWLGLFASISGAATTLQLLAPLGGEIVKSSLTIKWIASDPAGFSYKPVKIYYSLNGGQNYQIINSSIDNNGSYYWYPYGLPDSLQGRIKIEILNTNGETTVVESNLFTIVSVPYCYWDWSNQQGVLTGNTDYNLTWQAYDGSNDLTATPVNIYYQVNDGSWVTIALNQAAKGSFNWHVPAVDSENVRIKFETFDLAGNKGENIYYLSIRTNLPAVTLMSPNGGESLTGGKPHLITWSNNNAIGMQEYPYCLYYSIDSGTNYTKIIEGLYRYDSSYSWTVPNIDADQVKLKISATDIFGLSISDESDSSFSISVPPIGEVIYPNGKETLKAGSSYEIKWNPAGVGLNPSDYTVNLKYSLNDGAWQDISMGETNDGAYFWNALPLIDSNQVKIQVEILDVGQALVNSDICDAYVTIDNTPPSLTITEPNAETIASMSSSVNLKITYGAFDNSGFPNDCAEIFYSDDGGINYRSINKNSNPVYSSWFGIQNGIDTSQARIKVVVKDKAGWTTSAESPIFKVISYPYVDITSLNWDSDKNFFEGGQTHILTWKVDDYGKNLLADSVTLKYSTDNKKTWNIIAKNQPASGQYNWTLPSTDAYGCLRVEALDSAGNIGYQEKFFYVDNLAPSVSLIAPNGSEQLRAGSKVDIYWWASDAYMDLATCIALYYSTDNGINYQIITPIEFNDGSYSWTVPAVSSDQVRVKVEATDMLGHKTADESNATFKIFESINGEIKSPNGGESFKGGLPAEISWYTNNSNETINLKYSVDGTDVWSDIALDEINDGAYSWNVPTISNGFVKIKTEVLDASGSNIFSDVSDNYFAIDSTPPNILIIAPLTGDKKTIDNNNPLRIEWQATDNLQLASGPVDVYLSNDGGTTYNLAGSGWSAVSSTILSPQWNSFLINTDQARVKIIARDEAGLTTTVESGLFTIISLPSIDITRPIYYDNVFKGNSSQTIKWQASDSTGDLLINVKYSSDSENTWEILAAGEANDGEFAWQVPEKEVSSGYLKVEAIDADGNVGSDKEWFKIDITAPQVEITQPKAGQKMYAGAQNEIRWSTVENNFDYVSIYYSIDNGANYIPVTLKNFSNYLYSWQIPNICSDTVKLKIEAFDKVGQKGETESQTFAIAIPALGTLFAPNGGESWYSNSTYTIKWNNTFTGINSADYTANLKYSADEGVSWQEIASGLANSGTYSWKIPSEVSTSQAKVKVELLKGEEIISDESDSVFTILNYSSSGNENPDFVLTIKTPQAGAELKARSECNISWDFTGPAESLKTSPYYAVYYSIDAGQNYELIANINELTYIAWQMPEFEGNKLRIKVDAYSYVSDQQYYWMSYKNTKEVSFILDSTLPDKPTVTKFVSPTTAFSQTIFGSKSADSAKILVNDSTDGVVLISETEWNYPAKLSKGENILKIKAVDSAGNISEAIEVIILVQAVTFTDENTGASVKIDLDATDTPITLTFEQVDLPVQPLPGFVAQGPALKIQGNINTFNKEAQITLPIPTGINNPRVFVLDEANLSWKPIDTVQILPKIAEATTDNISFTSFTLGTFMVLDVIDDEGPKVSEIKINNKLVAEGDSIPSIPALSAIITDNFGVDLQTMQLVIDESAPKSLTSVSTKMSEKSLSINYILAEEDKLSEGYHTFIISAKDFAGNQVDKKISLYVIGASIPGLHIYPNPYKLGDASYIKFDGLTEDIRVRLYDISGAMVWSGANTLGSASLTWQAVNSAGRQVAPGVYLYLVTSNSGGKQSGKIAIIR